MTDDNDPETETGAIDAERPATMADQLNELSRQFRELRDDILLKPIARLLTAAGIETIDIADESPTISVFASAGAALAGPVTAYLGVLVGFYAGIHLTGSTQRAAIVGVGGGLLAGGVGLFVGHRYLQPGINQEADR